MTFSRICHEWQSVIRFSMGATAHLAFGCWLGNVPRALVAVLKASTFSSDQAVSANLSMARFHCTTAKQGYGQSLEARVYAKLRRWRVKQA